MYKVLLLVTITSCLFSSTSFWDKNQEGWFSYKDDIAIEHNETNSSKFIFQEPKVIYPNNLDSMSAEEFETYLENSKKTAVKFPTKENVKTYIKLQNYASNKASEFQDTWKELIIEDPSLDLSIAASKSVFMRDAKQKEMKRKQKEFWQKEMKNITLVFFYNPEDIEITLAQDKVFYLLNKDYPDLKVIKISLLEKPSFAKKLNIIYTPDIWMVYQVNNENIWKRIHTGLGAKDTLIEKIDYIYKKINKKLETEEI